MFVLWRTNLALMIWLSCQPHPASPAASKRESASTPDDLALVDAVERQLRVLLGKADIRCRVTARGVRIELGGGTLDHLLSSSHSKDRVAIEATISGAGRTFLGYAPYRRGSAFLRDAHHA